jgi:hypothetical protein
LRRKFAWCEHLHSPLLFSESSLYGRLVLLYAKKYTRV